MFSSYIDRQKAKVGSSERSQKVHSANWKEEVQLRKELYCLNRQEQQRVSRISSDQRLVVNRFQKKLEKSVDISKKHEQTLNVLDENRMIMKEVINKNLNKNEHIRTIRCLNAFPKPAVPKFTERRPKSCVTTKTNEIQKSMFSRKGSLQGSEKDLIPRPMTALEKRNKLWERQLSSVTQRINRARSAPAKPSFYKVPEFTNTPIKPAKRNCKTAPKQKGMNYLVDMEMYRYYRGKEIQRQNDAVRAYLHQIEGLELIPWTPYDEEDSNVDIIDKTESISLHRTPTVFSTEQEKAGEEK